MNEINVFHGLQGTVLGVVAAVLTLVVLFIVFQLLLLKLPAVMC